jgi:hypothetical protein
VDKSAIFIAVHGNDPEWAELRKNNYFDHDLCRALDGNREGMLELAIYGKFRPRIMRDLWKAGVSIRPYRKFVKEEWQMKTSGIIEALGDDLDSFLQDAGFSTTRLPDQFDVWRGDDEPENVMARRLSWTRSYSCAFALQDKIWRDARWERIARAEGYPEPLVLIRHIRREQAAAFIGGPEREVILSKNAIETPAQPCGSLRDWRRHRARSQKRVRVCVPLAGAQARLNERV